MNLIKKPITWVDAVCFALLCALLQYGMPQLKLLSVDTPWYSYLTGHLVHLHWQHWLLNMLALLCLPLLMPHIRRWQFWVAAVVFSVCISVALVQCGQLVDQNLSSYVGFSGVLHGLYMLFALQMLVTKSERYLRLQSTILVVAILIKTSYEMWFQPIHSAEFLGAVVVYAAHMDGVILGLIVFMLSYILCFRRQSL